MPDPGFISGIIGVCVTDSVHYILDQINIGRCCQKELNSLSEQVRRIEPIVSQIQQYRLQLNWKKGIRNEATAVNDWLTKLEGLLREASAMAQKCSRTSTWDVFSQYKTGKNVMKMTSEICQHLNLVPLMSWASLLGIIQSSASASSSAISSATASQPLIASTGVFIKEPLIVGQYSVLSALKKLVNDETADSPFSRIGVLGKGGSGKTLLLKVLFNCKEVRDFFRDELFLWLTVSQSPSLTSLMNELSAQMASYIKVNLDQNMSQEPVQLWLNERMKGRRFVLILDDVWENGAKLLEELGLLQLTNPSNSKVIVSSRSRSALLATGVPEKSIIKMEDLDEDDSWRLFAHHAFSHSKERKKERIFNVHEAKNSLWDRLFLYLILVFGPFSADKHPTNIHEGTAKLVCAKCGGLPLVIKAVGRAMAGTTYADDWELAVQRLPIANSEDKDAVFHRLRLSYDALPRSYGVDLQMCFLYLATFIEDQIIRADFRVIPLWTGAGLLGRKKLQNGCGSDPFETGKRYINILADSCLIEPIHRDVDGNVLEFRMHDVIRDLAIQIAEQEEKFYCGTGRGLTRLTETECSGRTRILLNHNSLTSLPESLSSNEISTLMVGNNNITSLPRTLVGGMSSLTVLDLSFTLLSSLPDSVGSMKQLVFLNLTQVPVTALPPSLTNLVNLQILNLTGTKITELPYDIHKLISLRYLSLDLCSNLLCLPHGISRLASLQYFFFSQDVMWTEHRAKHMCKRVASINDLGKLTQLKALYLTSKGQAIRDGTFGNLAHLETLELNLTATTGLPHDITKLGKLRKFSLYWADVVQMGSNFCQLQCLTHLQLHGCTNLEELPQLHELRSLRQLDIVDCVKIKTLPREFGSRGSFPLLEIISLVGLDELKELPALEDGAMLSLKMLTLMRCLALQRLRKAYLNLIALPRIRIFGCPMLLENFKRMEKTNTRIEITAISLEDTEASESYYQFSNRVVGDRVAGDILYDEFWHNELIVFIDKINTRIWI